MAGRDTVHELQPFNGIFAQSLGATGSGGKSTGPIKLDGSFGCLFDINYGSVTATNASVVVTMLEGDATGALNAVATSSVIGGAAALTAAGIGQGARVAHSTKAVSKTVQYVGPHEYVELVLAPKISGGIIASVTALLAPLRQGPATPVG